MGTCGALNHTSETTDMTNGYMLPYGQNKDACTLQGLVWPRVMTTRIF